MRTIAGRRYGQVIDKGLILFQRNFEFFLLFPRYKLRVADSVISHLNPIRQKIEDYMRNPDYLTEVLVKGGQKSSEIAERTIDEVKDKVGLGFSRKLSHLNRIVKTV